jgi:UDP-N-acetyl-2-amino-2-deoxyglucuronate dehydrogenase
MSGESMTMHVGLIGAGNISQTHARALQLVDEVALAAIYAPTRAHADRVARQYEIVATDSLDALFAHRPLDAVVIGSPSGLHAEHGVAAARRGLHVLVEKPIDITSARADALIEAAARARVTLGVIFQDRLKPDVQRLKSLVDQGRIGRPILANARVKWYRPPSYYRESRWRGTRALDGGGALMNQGVHTVDLLLWLWGPVRRVFAKTIAGLHTIEVEDTAVAVLEFANGALGTLEAATSAYPGYSRTIELTGSNGTAMLVGDDLAAIDLLDARDDEQPTRPAAATASAASPVVADPTAHVRVFEDFFSAVRHRTAPICDGRGARPSVALIEAIYRSAATGLPIDLAARDEPVGATALDRHGAG